MMFGLHGNQFVEGFKQHALPKPEENKASDEVAHAEEADARHPRNEHHHQCHPEWVVENHHFYVVKVRTERLSIMILIVEHSFYKHFLLTSNKIIPLSNN